MFRHTKKSLSGILVYLLLINHNGMSLKDKSLFYLTAVTVLFGPCKRYVSRHASFVTSSMTVYFLALNIFAVPFTLFWYLLFPRNMWLCFIPHTEQLAELYSCVKWVLLLLLLYDMNVSCHRPFLPGNSLEPAVIPTAQASSFTLQYFPYYVWC
jgi:hypothetical protein